jgi:phosphoglycolate phosphatase
MKQHGIIFDCDGTLVDSLGQALESFNFALDRVGFPPRAPETIKRYFGTAADRILLSVVGDKNQAVKAFDYFLEHQSDLAKTTKLHPGIRELLDLLEENEIPLGIVTGRHARDLDIVLRPHRLADYFITLIADSHLPKSKPAPDGILMAAEKMGLPPAQTMYVGDSIFDIQAAHAAGTGSVAALWDSLAKSEELSHEKPDFMAHTPKDVWTYFTERFGN